MIRLLAISQEAAWVFGTMSLKPSLLRYGFLGLGFSLLRCHLLA
jgi:hypothetical protein